MCRSRHAGREVADERLAKPRNGHGLQHLFEKSEGEERTSARFLDAPGSEIEGHPLVELSHRGAVGALHVVSVNLELRLGINLHVRGEQEIGVGLVGIGLLGARMNEDPAVEDPLALPSSTPL